jgi:putative tricarboxylic transport membrane protein
MEMIFNMALGIITVVYLVFSFMLDKKSTEGDIFGAGGFPIVVGILALVALARIVYTTIKNKEHTSVPMFEFKSEDGKVLILNVAILTAYILLMDVIGFALSTLFFLLGSGKAMGYKKNAKLIMFSVLLTVALVISFGMVFFVPLPRGVGFFRELSYLIY